MQSLAYLWICMQEIPQGRQYCNLHGPRMLFNYLTIEIEGNNNPYGLLPPCCRVLLVRLATG